MTLGDPERNQQKRAVAASDYGREFRPDVARRSWRGHATGNRAGQCLRRAALKARSIPPCSSPRSTRLGNFIARSQAPTDVPSKHLTSCTKSNGISISMPFWDQRVAAVMREYPDVRVDRYHVDILTAHFVHNRHWFDVVVATNLFGDTLSDLSPAGSGTIGLRSEDQLGIHDPGRAGDCREHLLELVGSEAELALGERRTDSGQELAAKHTAQDTNWKKEVAAGGDPASAVWR
jgi:hypothetical protein